MEEKRSCSSCTHQSVCRIVKEINEFLNHFYLFLEVEDLTKEFFQLLAKKCKYYLKQEGS